jgi:hypothetical protein
MITPLDAHVGAAKLSQSQQQLHCAENLCYYKPSAQAALKF